MIYRFCLFLIFLLTRVSYGNSQATFTQSLDSTHIIIGDECYLTQTSSILPTNEESLPQLEQLKWLEILDKGSWILTPNQKHERKIKFSVYDSGVYVIPEIQIRLDSQFITTTKLFLEVHLPMDTLNDIHPIKDIIETEKKNYIWIYITLALLFIGLSIFLLIILFRADQIQIKKLSYKSLDSPYEIALQRIKTLKEKKLWQSGKMKEHYDELSYVLRAFLNDGFHLRSLESSTSETETKLQESTLNIQYKNEFISFLRNCDLIKFANKVPPVEEHDSWIQFAEKMLSHNKDLSSQFLNINKKDYTNILGNDLAAQFQIPGEYVPNTLLELMNSTEVEEIYLISRLFSLHRFVLPTDWVNLHLTRSGQLRNWHLNILLKNQGSKGKLILAVTLPLISIFLPFMVIIGWLKKENVLGRGVFLLSKDKKIVVNESSLEK